MKIRNLLTIGLMVAGFATMAQAQNYYGSVYNAPGRYVEQRDERRDIGRDLRVREDLNRRIEADRRAVEHERWELRHSYGYVAAHESRELQAAQFRLDNDYRALHGVNVDLYRDRRDRY